MGSRERKRADRRKRKARGQGTAPRERMQEAYARAEERNREAREALVPLREGERPRVVTVGALLSALVSLSIVGAYLAGAKVDGERPELAQVLAPALLMGIMAWGMWRARYWAVLGFQAVLLFLLFATVLGLVQATSAAQLAGNVLLLTLAGTLFFLMVKAMARIQMPSRLPRE